MAEVQQQKSDLDQKKTSAIQVQNINVNHLPKQVIDGDITDVPKNMNVQNNFGVVGTSGISRERSFVRNAGQGVQNANKRRSLAIQQQQQIRIKPALEIYRPPTTNPVRYDGNNSNKLNVHAQEFTMQNRNDIMNAHSRHVPNFHQMSGNLQHSKSSGNMHFNIKYVDPMHVQMNRPMVFNQMQIPIHPMPTHLPLIASPSTGNVLQQHRVKFAPDPPTVVHHRQQQPQAQQYPALAVPTPLQRSKSLTSADNLISRSIAGLSLTADISDIGTFAPDIQALIDKALVDPNQLSARVLMELTLHIMGRACEGRRYALPVSKFCILIIAKEKKETFLEAMLNTCRQWYTEREKMLGPLNAKIPGRPRFMSFMSFLTEMFCQLKRRQLQLRTQCDGAPPPLVLLTLLEKCCEDCVRSPVRSLSEIECLFFVLTCIGRDLETHMPQQLGVLMTKVRDAFLNSNSSAPSIRRTLLQLIELQASHWQLPGMAITYYYPTQRQNTTT